MNRSLAEHSADYRDLILITRSLREQIDWAQLRERTAANAFAAAYFTLADGLEISARSRAQPASSALPSVRPSRSSPP